jgi:PKD repeat protein
VTASVTDAYGLSGRATQKMTIAQNQPPTALLTVSPTSARAGSVFTASAASSSDPDDVVVASIIDFGDGFVTEGFTASHAYAGGGNYTVTARVTDSRGARSVATSTITVGDFVLTANAADPAKPATLVVTVSPSPKMNETVSLSCSGLAAGYSCRFDSAAVDLAGGPAISTLTVSANPATARKSSPAPLLAFCLPLACIIATGISRRVIRYGLLGLAALSLLLTLSCGGGSTQSQAKRIPVIICGTAGSLQRSITTSVTIP